MGTPRPLADIGARFRFARELAGLKQYELAKRAKMRPAQVSLLESGYNIEAKFYARIAKTLGYRSVSELLDVEDAPTRNLLRLWRAMDDETREIAYRKLRVWLIED